MCKINIGKKKKNDVMKKKCKRSPGETKLKAKDKRTIAI